MEITQNELLQILGLKEVEIYVLKKRIVVLEKEIKELKEKQAVLPLNQNRPKTVVERFSQKNEEEKPKEEP